MTSSSEYINQDVNMCFSTFIIIGETALSLAAGGGITRVAKPLVRKNHDLLGIKNINDVIPVVVAAQFGHTDMVHFLYYMTQEEDLDPYFLVDVNTGWRRIVNTWVES